MPIVLLPAALAAQTIQIRFLDSATGCAIQPETVTTRAHQPGAKERRVLRPQVNKAGNTALALGPGRHTVQAVSLKHQPMSADLDAEANQAQVIQFQMDPLEEPREMHPDYVVSLHREDATLIQGFVVDEETREPLPGVRVSSAPSGVETHTDGRGFFQFYVPLQGEAEAAAAPANLVFARGGYQSQERQHIELWSNGDWTYRIRLAAGRGRQVIDERDTRRRITPDQSALTPPQAQPAVPATPADSELLKSAQDASPKATAETNSTVRVPRNIRVILADNVTVDYVTMLYYVRCVLPSEWIASWGSYTGGTNSLNAGAVAARCYAIARLNNAGGNSTSDICATTSCQVYNPTRIHSLTDAAVYFTDNWVVLSGGAVPSTEYSAENNSIGSSCGDSWTQPSGGCIFDPVCTGEARYGHGRGMCQWGSARWATGRKMAGRTSSDSTPNGYPRRDWKWIVQHYYPNATLVKGAPLMVGDDIRAMESVNVNLCADGGITNGINCTLLATLPSNTTGVIVDGPQRITADGKGFTWYKVQWNNAASTLGWAKENYLERVFSLPTAPTGLTATASGTNRINLAWTETAGPTSAGFKIERAISAAGPWTQLNTVAADVTSCSDLNLYPGSTWYYRVCAYNAGGNSPYSSVATATTATPPPTLNPIADRIIVEHTPLTLTNTATAPDLAWLITDFENFTTDTTNGLPLFRRPRYSGSTSNNLATTPDLSIVTDAYATSGHGTGRVLRVNCSFTNSTNPWLRLTTANAPNWPNPVIDFTRRLRFDLYTDNAVKVAIGCREISTATGTPLGTNGGNTGAIEWAGVTNLSGTAPMPTRTVAAGAWTTLTFDLPNEPTRNFSNGNGVLYTASGLGVLEHLAIVPVSGTGTNNFYLDNFAVVAPRMLTYSLGAGAPTNAVVNPVSGVFTWTPNETQGPSTNSISVIVTDNSMPPSGQTNTFTVVVLETNSAPALVAPEDRVVHAGSLVTFTNAATDADLPTNTLAYSLDAGAPASAAVDPTTGVFVWLTADADAGTTNPITVRVADNGAAPLSDAKTFTVTVRARPGIEGITLLDANATLTWSAISRTKYRVQFKDDLGDANWTDVVPDVTASGPTVSITDTPGVLQRFYRIRVVN